MSLRQRSRTATELNGSGRHSDKYGRRPTSILAHLKRRISDKKWKEAHEWSVSRPNQEPQIRHQTPQADHGPDARKSETHRSPILPAKNMARPYGYSPEVGQTAGGRPVLVVLPIQTDPGAFVQALHPTASPAKGDVGKSGEGHKAREAQVEDGGTARRREVQRSRRSSSSSGLRTWAERSRWRRQIRGALSRGGAGIP